MIKNLDSLFDKEKLIPFFKGSHKKYTFVINKELYFFKEMPLRELISELVSVEIAKLINVPVLNLEIAVLKDSYGTLSKSFQSNNEKKISLSSIMKDCFYKYNEDEEQDFDYFMKIRLNNLEDIRFSLKERYHNNIIVSNLMNAIIDIFCFDILTEQGDRHLDNLEILENDKEIRLAPCFDNSSIYSGKKVCLGIDRNVLDNNEEILNKFLSISSEEQIQRFKNMFNTINRVGIKFILNNIEQKNNLTIYDSIKQDFINSYQKQMTLIFDCLENLEKIR